MGGINLDHDIMQILDGETIDEEYDEVREEVDPKSKKKSAENHAKTVTSEKFYYMSQNYQEE